MLSRYLTIKTKMARPVDIINSIKRKENYDITAKIYWVKTFREKELPLFKGFFSISSHTIKYWEKNNEPNTFFFLVLTRPSIAPSRAFIELIDNVIVTGKSKGPYLVIGWVSARHRVLLIHVHSYMRPPTQKQNWSRGLFLFRLY